MWHPAWRHLAPAEFCGTLRRACNQGRRRPFPRRIRLSPFPVLVVSRRRLLATLGAVLPALALLHPGPASAHAVVTASDPAAGATLAAAPRHLTIRFNSRIDHGRSRLVLVGPEGVQLPLELAPEGEPTVLEVALDPAARLAPGAWRLRWQVLAVDGHITRGDIPFTLTAP